MRDVPHWLKVPGIYLSEHETFRSGNIARGGVIETISRKAISPLAQSITTDCYIKICRPVPLGRGTGNSTPMNIIAASLYAPTIPQFNLLTIQH